LSAITSGVDSAPPGSRTSAWIPPYLRGVSTRQAIASAPCPAAATTGPFMPRGSPGRRVGAGQAAPGWRSSSLGAPSPVIRVVVLPAASVAAVAPRPNCAAASSTGAVKEAVAAGVAASAAAAATTVAAAARRDPRRKLTTPQRTGSAHVAVAPPHT
jgi:hypothetical protein